MHYHLFFSHLKSSYFDNQKCQNRLITIFTMGIFVYLWFPVIFLKIPKLKFHFSLIHEKILVPLLESMAYICIIYMRNGNHSSCNIEELLAQTYGRKLCRLKFTIRRDSVNSAQIVEMSGYLNNGALERLFFQCGHVPLLALNV